jgi:hypothetical protein
VFPAWFTCNAVETAATAEPDGAAAAAGPRRRRMVKWQALDPERRRRYQDDAGKSHDVTPLRFVCGCQNGHLQDVPWCRVVHGETACAQPLWLEESGTSGDARDLRVVCGCGRSLLLPQLYQGGRLGFCNGNRPWIGDRDPSGCIDESGKPVTLRLLSRNATHAYFPQVARVISLPEADDAIGRPVAPHLSDLQEAQSAADIGQARKFNQAVRAALEGISDEAVFARLRQLLASGGGGGQEPNPRIAEYELLASGAEIIGEDAPHARLHAQTLPRQQWDPDHAPLLQGIGALVAVHRLREVACLYGFTRFESSPQMTDGDLEDVGLAVRGAPLGAAPDWLPAIEQFGEGVFLRLEPDAIAEWLTRENTRRHLEHLEAGLTRRTTRTGMPSQSFTYMLLHSLAHALVTEIALDCGYPASALKERIYALPQIGSEPMRCGLLVYTATAGTQGTLGGLVEITTRFAGVLESALRRLELCSSDPVCADHDPSAHSDDRATHGAACHGCLLIAETSCESRNLFLDRALLVDTMAEPGAAFFSLHHRAP